MPLVESYRRLNRREGYPVICQRCAGGQQFGITEKLSARTPPKPMPPPAPQGATGKCRGCGEAIYAHNGEWRHAGNKRAESGKIVACTNCVGGRVGRKGQETLCRFCYGRGTREVFDHMAEPEETT